MVENEIIVRGRMYLPLYRPRIVPSTNERHHTKFKRHLLVSISPVGPISAIKMFMTLMVISQGFESYFRNRHVNIIPPSNASRSKSQKGSNEII